MEKFRDIMLVLLVDLIVVATVFSVSGLYNTKVDAPVYVSQIEAYRAGTPFVAGDQRAFKALYGFVGSLFPHSMDPNLVILIMNLVFLIGATVASYYFFLELGFENDQALWGSVWFATGYPILKYGLAISTDISGIFFSLLTILAVMTGVRKNNVWLLVLASLVGFAGSLSKETGALGLIFGGVYLLSYFGVWEKKKVVKNLLVFCLPFWVLEFALLAVLQSVGSTNFLEWYKFAWQLYGTQYYNLFYFMGVEGSTFHIFALFALAGIIYLMRYRGEDKRKRVSELVSLFIASSPMMLWPIFVSRILYPQFLFILPLALYGTLAARSKARPYLMVLPVIVSFALYLVAGNGSLFSSLGK
jgi:4-amino-4-deoxy-L-arabinose transferase-like glycosyltransferase